MEENIFPNNISPGYVLVKGTSKYFSLLGRDQLAKKLGVVALGFN